MEHDSHRLEVYDQQVLAEIAAHVVSPSPLQTMLDVIGRPLDRVLARLAASNGELQGRIATAISHGVKKAISRSVVLGGKIMRDSTVLRRFRKAGYGIRSHQEIAELPLVALDRVAATYRIGSAVLLSSEGAILGAAASLAEMAPAAQLVLPTLIATDVGASMTLLSRNLVQLGSCYGFSVRQDRRNIAHVLGAMLPPKLSYDEGFVPLKLLVINAAREAGEFSVKVGAHASQLGFETAMHQLAREAPQLIRLINLVVERLGLRITQKVFGLLVPIIGGAVNGGLNLAFQRTGQRTGRDYFRLLHLTSRYGDETIRQLLQEQIELQRRSQAAAQSRQRRPGTSRTDPAISGY